MGEAAPRVASDVAARADWLAGDPAQVAVHKVEATLTNEFGEDDKAVPDRRLSRGLIGVTADDATRELVVVIDPTKIDAQRLGTRLGEVMRTLRASGGGDLRLRVEHGCRDSADLLEAGQLIRERGWHPRASSSVFSGYLDARTSVHHLTFSQADRPVAEALRQRLGDRVSITYGGARRTDRADDGQPHWGGAGIGLVGRANDCSSGFTVDTATAGKAMVTAGHCFNNGERVESGDEAYGTAQGKYDYPAYDMMLINASNQNYDDDIYHDPIRAESNPLDVASGSADPVAGTSVCISGIVHRSVCGNVVKELNAYLCDEGGCTYSLIRTVRSGDDPCLPGTSGGAMYKNSSPTVVHGLLIGMEGPEGGPAVACLGEKVSVVQRHLGVKVATSP